MNLLAELIFKYKSPAKIYGNRKIICVGLSISKLAGLLSVKMLQDATQHAFHGRLRSHHIEPGGFHA